MATSGIVDVATAGLVTVCTYCLQVIAADGSTSVSLFSQDIPADVPLSHGCCDSCKADQKALIAAERARRQGQRGDADNGRKQ